MSFTGCQLGLSGPSAEGESRDHALLQSRLEQAKRCSVLYQTEDLRRHKDGSPQRFLDSVLPRKDGKTKPGPPISNDKNFRPRAVNAPGIATSSKLRDGPCKFSPTDDAWLGGLDAVRV